MDLTEKAEVAKLVYEFFESNYTRRPEQADVAFVFGRNDLSIARAASSLWLSGRVGEIVVSGGVGKDSRGLPQSEADFLAAHIYSHGVSGQHIHIERHAQNEAENSRLGLKLVEEYELPHQRVILVGHPTNLLRLFAVHTLVASEVGVYVEDYQMFVPPYQLREADHDLVIGEFKRLIEWPAKGWSHPLHLPQILVDLVKKV